MLVAEDGMADHQVAEGGDYDRNESVPGEEEYGEEHVDSGAENGRPKPVPGGLEEGQDGHVEKVGKAVTDYGGVEARPLLSPEDGGGPDVDDCSEGQQRNVHPGVGRGQRLIHHFSPIGEESEVTKEQGHHGFLDFSEEKY